MGKTVVAVVGVPGVGKTTVLNLVVKELTSEGFNVKVINFGDYMFNVLHAKGIVKSRDEIRHQSMEVQINAQLMAAEEIRKEIDLMQDVGNNVVIIDTHAVIKTGNGFWSGLPEYVVKRIQPKAIVIIESSVEEIMSRQGRDKNRYRADYNDPRLLNELLMMNRMYAIASAVLVGAVVRIVYNREGAPGEAAQEIVNLITALG